MLNEYLSTDKQVYWDYTLPNKDYFDLFWDDDIIRLTRKDAEGLIPILTAWVSDAPTHVQ